MLLPLGFTTVKLFTTNNTCFCPANAYFWLYLKTAWLKEAPVYLQDQGQSVVSKKADTLKAGPYAVPHAPEPGRERQNSMLLHEAADRLLRIAFPDNIA